MIHADTRVEVPTTSRDGRTLTTRYPFGVDADGVETFAEVRTSHYGRAEYVGRPDRVIVATITVVQVDHRDGISVTSWSSDMPYVRVAVDDCPRYSAKRLAATHARALEIVEGDYGIPGGIFDDIRATAERLASA